MRVLTLTNMYPPHHYGGYELTCEDVMRRWRARGHEVTVLTTDLRVPGVESDDRERESGVWRDLRWYWDDHVVVAPSRRARLGIERSNQRALAAALAAAQPDVVSVWHMGAMSMGLLATLVDRGVPAVYVVCDDWLDYAPRIDAWARLFLRHPWVARAVRGVTGLPTKLADIAVDGTFCFVSDHVRRHARRHGHWLPRRETVVYSGIDRDDFPRRLSEEDRPWRWRLLYVGRLDPRKSVDVAIRALALLPPEATLDVVGRGDPRYAERLRRLAEETGVAGRVRFDAVARNQLRARYADADAVVFPVTWDEPFGLVPLEAMASGTPVVATGTGGSGEFLVDGENCLLHRPGDATSLAHALRRLAGDAQLRRRLVAGGGETADQLDVEHLADALESWHLAAADRFRAGEPPQRTLLVRRASPG